MTDQERFELLQSQVEALLESQTLEKPQKVGVRVKEAMNRSLLNFVDDLPTTVTGLGVGVAVVVSQWPNVDHLTIIEAFGFSTLGGISNGKSPANQNTFDENEIG